MTTRLNFLKLLDRISYLFRNGTW